MDIFRQQKNLGPNVIYCALEYPRVVRVVPTSGGRGGGIMAPRAPSGGETTKIRDLRAGIWDHAGRILDHRCVILDRGSGIMDHGHRFLDHNCGFALPTPRNHPHRRPSRAVF